MIELKIWTLDALRRQRQRARFLMVAGRKALIAFADERLAYLDISHQISKLELVRRCLRPWFAMLPQLMIGTKLP